jgi:signal peptidase I
MQPHSAQEAGVRNAGGEIPEHCMKCCWGAGAGLPPCREESQELAPAGALTPLSAWAGQSLAVCSLELAKFLTELGKTAFRALGTCMYPTVLPGDLLHIEPGNIRGIQVGDIVVFRRGGNFFGHRTIAKGEDTHGPYILTRPDRSFSGDDGPSYDRDLLGIVRRIERNSRILGPEPKTCTRWEQAYYSCRLILIEFKQAAIARLQGWLISAQQTGMYQLFAEFWLARSSRALDFVIQTPLHDQTASSFFRKFAGSEIDTFNPGDHGGPAYWTITLQVDHKPAAMLAFFRCPEECPYAGWWLSEAYSRIRYRGTGIEEKLFRKAKEILASSSVRFLKISLPKKSPELRTWGLRGFKEKPGFPERESAAAQDKPVRRSILEAAIG